MDPETTPKTINTGVKLDVAMHTRLKALGERKDRSPHWLMRTAIEEYVVREEAAERERLEDMERWQRYQLTGHAISHDEAMAWLDSVGGDNELPCPK